MNSHILQFNNVLSADLCQMLINKFQQDPARRPGRTGSGVDPSKKLSTDLSISSLTNWQSECSDIQGIIKQGLVHYVREYPFLITGAVSPTLLDPHSGQPIAVQANDIASLSDESLSFMLDQIFEQDDINMQFYEAGKGGYPHWHSEQFPDPNRDDNASLHRVLLWLIYLNDVEDGGETQFIYQQASIKPKTGSLVLAPCGFTHTHRGVTPQSNHKYVLASWVKYLPRERLYQTR